MPETETASARSPSSHALVVAQLAAVAACCVPLQDQGPVWVLIACIAGIGLGVVTLAFNRIGNFSVYPEPKTGAILVTNGPYRVVRHPMYDALALMMLGVAAYNGHWANGIAWCVLLAALCAKAMREERFLGDAFPEYRDYQVRTSRFVPGVW
jgi:protein-S-isoprenylcysteine O-methyltransferase Ste14